VLCDILTAAVFMFMLFPSLSSVYALPKIFVQLYQAYTNHDW
jgi:hypothetical protein